MSAVPAVNRSAPVAARVRQRPTRLIDVSAGPAVTGPGHNNPPAEPEAVNPNLPSPELVEKVIAFVDANEASKKAESATRKAKAAMEKGVEQSDLTQFAVEHNGKTWDITNLPAEGEVIDANKLKAAVDGDTFMKIVERLIKSARGGKGAVEEVAGSSIANKCLDTQTKPASVKITERK